jgi:S-DNA-T family DNA segregation ATPase FtsK/SpoIIIE|tara:strand:- start:1640 stop:3940 length:2301 start_codon:yes stop_codon:yes gene_type:complete
MSPNIKNTLISFFSFFLIAFSLYIFISLLSYDSSDSGYWYRDSSSTVNNLGGPLGAFISDYLFTLIGFGSYLLLLISSTWCIQVLFFNNSNISKLDNLLRLSSSVLLLICFCSIGHFYLTNNFGGFFGNVIFTNLSSLVGEIGALIFLIILIIPSISMSFNFSWLKATDYFGKKLILTYTVLLKGMLFLLKKITGISKSIFSKLKKIVNYTKTNIADKKITKTKPKIKNQTEIKNEEKDLSEKPIRQGELPIKENDLKVVPKKEIDTTKEVTTNQNKITPSTELLDRALDDGQSLSENELNQIATLLETKLDEFGIEATVESVIPGPVVTRFEIQPAPGTKASKITNIAQDIARSLSVSSVRVVEVIEGKSYVGVEIPNNNRKMVRLTEILSSDAFKNSSSSLSLALGKDISGNPVVADLAKMPHLLVAGTTGSGKSVGLNAMLLSLLFKSDPEEVRMILIDPKMLELSVYDGIPHLLTPVITDMSNASNGLRWCVAEMDRRYKLMSLTGVKSLAAYNKKIKDAEKNDKQIVNPLNEDEEEFLETLPSIVVVVDEFADMMMLVGKKLEHLIARIAQKARAAGIHLILATQRPSVDVITGLIKANMPTRIAFQVSTKIDSRTILDQGGAEQLLGDGDMLYFPPGVGVPKRVHGAFVGDDEVHRVVSDMKSKAEPNYVEEIISSKQETGPITGWTTSETSSDEEQDELYDEAVNFVIDSRRASISAVQRKLRIGYNRAARLIETMEEAGIVSEMSSNGSREVLVPKRD